MTIRELKEQRTKLITEARGVYDSAKADNRETLNTEERLRYDATLAAVGEIDKQITEHERAEEDRAALTKLEADAKRPEQRRSAPPVDRNEDRGNPLASPEYRAEFGKYFRSGVMSEQRAMSLGSNSTGGYMALPLDLSKILLKTIDDMCDIYADATKLQVNDAIAVGIPKITARGEDADWNTEIQAVDEDTALTFGRGDLTPNLVTKLIKASWVFVNRVGNAETIIMEQMGRLFAVTWEKALLTGTGIGQPRGIFTASASGIPTSRDVSSGNTTTEISYDGLVRAKYSVKQAYLNRPTTKWIAHPDFMANVLMLRDNEDRPLFMPGDWKQGREDTLLGVPVKFSEFAPNTYTTGLYVAIIGDMSQIYIADAENYSVQVVRELYAATSQLGFIGRTEGDANAQQSEAFARVTLA